jgi:hypothetical protein
MIINKDDVGGAHSTCQRRNAHIFLSENLKGRDKGVHEMVY